MPTISPKYSLGSLFGGDVTSLNFNFQTGSEASSATLTIFNKDNKYQRPALGSSVILPIFGIQMNVVEDGLVDDSTFKFLQVELVDSSSDILDKNLIFIRGIHSTGLQNDEQNKEKYHWFDFCGAPDKGISNRVSANVLFAKASRLKKTVGIGDGAYLMGRIRAIFQPKSETLWNNGRDSWNPSEDPIWVKWDGGQIVAELSRWKGESVPPIIDQLLRIEGPPSIQYGYSLADLKALLISLGMSVSDNGAMGNDSILFSNSGTVRSCLSSALASIGRSFYVDPFSKRIVVISNGDIAKINNNLIQKLDNFNITGAEQVSYVRSIKDVNAVHVTLKATLDPPQRTESPSFDSNPKPSKSVFKRLPIDGLFKDIDRDEMVFIKKVIYLVAAGYPDDVIDKYLFGLAQKVDPATWSSSEKIDDQIYGDKSIKKGVFERINLDQEWRGYVLNNISEIADLNGFDFSFTTGAYELYTEGKKGNRTNAKIPALSASERNVYEILRNVNQLWAGVYISPPTTQDRISKRNYLPGGSHGGNRDSRSGQSVSLSFFNAPADAYVSEVEELSFLQQLIVKSGGRPNLKISDLARIAGINSLGGTAIGERWHTIALRKNFAPKEDDVLGIKGIEKAVNRNMFVLEIPEREQLFLLVTQNFASIINNILKLCENSFKEETGRTKNKITTFFEIIRTDNSKSSEGLDDSESDADEDPKVFYLKNIPSKIRNFSKREILFIQGDYLEVSLFEKEINEIAPQFEGPMVSSDIRYFRPPKRSDIDVSQGVDSVSVSMDESGVTTQIRYSSRKYAEVDQSILVDYLGNGFKANSPAEPQQFKRRSKAAFAKNRSGD